MCTIKRGKMVLCDMEIQRREEAAARAVRVDGSPLSDSAIKRMISEVFGPAPSDEEVARTETVNLSVQVIQGKMAELGHLPEEKRREWVAFYLAAVMPSDVLGLALVDLVAEVTSLRETIEAKERALTTSRNESSEAYEKIKDLRAEVNKLAQENQRLRIRVNDLSRPLGIRPVDLLGKPRGYVSKGGEAFGDNPRTTQR